MISLSGVYDIIYSVGVFAASHAKEDAFEEMIRILKPGENPYFFLCLHFPSPGHTESTAIRVGSVYF